MWAFVVEYYEKYGAIIPVGNSGQQKLRNKTFKEWLAETEIMRKNTTGNVYVLVDFTQAMCEMSPKQLADYVQNHYVTILKAPEK